MKSVGPKGFVPLFIGVMVLLWSWQVGYAACRSIAGLAVNGAYGVADRNGRVLDSCNIEQPMVPASVLKLATVLAALRMFGPEFRFSTEFYADSSHNLYIKGFGDPNLITEEIIEIVKRLRAKGLEQVRTLYVDDSAFSLATQVPGQEKSDRSYDAPVGPLSVNFNSVPLHVDEAGRVGPGEPLTPMLPIMQELGKGQSPGQHRINVCGDDCVPRARMAQYAAELFAALLRQGGVPVAAIGGIEPVPQQEGRLLYRHESTRTLIETSRSLLYYSSNFTANLVFLNCGAKKFGYPATWQKAQQAVHQELVQQLGDQTANAIVQVEGAGLSRQNRVTARAMLALLARFRPHMELLKQEQGERLKTGTMTGVYNYAGYFSDGKAFVILLNQSANARAAVLEKLKRLHEAPAH